MSKIEVQVINKIRSRAELGKNKYGTTMERNDLTNAEWLKHLQDKLMDAAVYVEKLLTLIDIYDEGLVKCPIPLEQWPDWANWAAMDANNYWYFFKSKPAAQKRIWYCGTYWRDSNFKGSDFPWYDTLTHRSELENQKQ